MSDEVHVIWGKEGNEEALRNEQESEAKSLMRRSVMVRRVVLFLAALEQGATYLAQIAFLGATVVLLGGYASRLKFYDFNLISALLLSEGVRVFLASRNDEYSLARGAGLANFSPGVFFFPVLVIVLSRFGKDMSMQMAFQTILQVLQMGSAAVTFGFSVARLKSGDYITTSSESPSDTGEVANFLYGIRLFYILTLVESSVYLAVKALAWDLFMLQWESEAAVLNDFAVHVYTVFVREGFGKASATNLFTWIILEIELEDKYNSGYNSILDILSWKIPEEAKTTESIKSLIRLTAPGVPKKTSHCANKFLARIVLKGTFKNFLLAVPEFGRVPLEVLDAEVIEFLHRIVTDAPLGFLPPETVSKQASEFLIRSIVEGNDKIQAALTFLKWWSDPTTYRRYVLDPADIFYRLFIHGQQQQCVRPKLDLDIVHYSELEEIFGYEKIAQPIKAAFTEGLELPRSIIMEQLLNRVDFSKLKNKQSTVNLSGILPEIISAVSPKSDYVIRLVAAWIWFMDESTFQKAICKLSEEELGMLKNCAPIYEAILTSQKKEWFQEKGTECSEISQY